MLEKKIFSIVAIAILTSCSPLSVMATSTQTSAPSLTPAPAMASPTPTPYHVYIVTADALEVRTGPTETADHVGYLVRDDIVTVYETAQAEQEYCKTWAKIHPSQERWVCFQFLKG